MAAKKPPLPSSTPPPSNVAEKSDILEIKNMMLALRDEIKLTRDDANKEFSAVRQDLNKVIQNLDHVNQEIKEMKEVIDKNQQRIQKVEEKSQIHDGQIQDILLDGRRYEKSSLVLETDRAEFYLRFQNIPEEKGENIGEIIAEILAEFMEEEKERIIQDIDEVYRISTRFALRNNLPREVHVRFTKKTRRIQILQKSRIATFKYKERDITILKQVPRKVRELRKDYQFLTSKLHQRGINFRWLVPEGIFLAWQGQRYRLDSVSKAELFYRQKLEQQDQTSKEPTTILQPIVRRETGLKELSEEHLLGMAAGISADQPLTQEEWALAQETLSIPPKDQRQGVVTRAAKERQKP